MNANDEARQDFAQGLFPLEPPLDNFGIKVEDVKARIGALRGETNQSKR